MSTAQVLYQQYKVLPKGIQKELKALIISEEEEKTPLIEQIAQGLREVKLIREGKMKATSFEDFLKEMKDGN